MKLTVVFFIILINSPMMWACEKSADEQDQAIKAKITTEWRTVPRYQWPRFETLPYTLEKVEQIGSSQNYQATIKRGQTICKQLSYQVTTNADCSIDASLISIQGCL